jgi:hypothetical protein
MSSHEINGWQRMPHNSFRCALTDQNQEVLISLLKVPDHVTLLGIIYGGPTPWTSPKTFSR